MTLLLLSLNLASASVRSDAAGSYNDVLVDVYEAWALELDALYMQAWEDGSAEAWDAFDAGVVESSERTLATLHALPPFEGDASLRDVMAASVQLQVDQQSDAIPRRNALWSLEHVRWHDVEELDVVQRELDRQNQAMEDQVLQVQAAFAARFDVDLDPATVLHGFEPPPFDPPGMPQADTALHDWERADLALRFHNESIQLFNAGIDAWNLWTLTQDDFAGQRAIAHDALQAPVDQARTLGPWNASTDLADATQAFLRTVQDLLGDTSIEIARLRDRRVLLPWSRRRAVQLMDEQDAVIQLAGAEFDAHTAHFSDLWALSAYQAWAQAQ
jgi:hypothetical protein